MALPPPDDLFPINQDNSSSGIGGPITPQQFNQIQWDRLHKAQVSIKTTLEKEIQELRLKVHDQDQQLRDVTWMCKSCQSSFPKMAVRTSIRGTLQCPRCANHEPGNVVQAVEAVRSIFLAQVKKLEEQVAELTKHNADLTKENQRLKDLDRMRRLRPDQPRTVEET